MSKEQKIGIWMLIALGIVMNIPLKGVEYSLFQLFWRELKPLAVLGLALWATMLVVIIHDPVPAEFRQKDDEEEEYDDE